MSASGGASMPNTPAAAASQSVSTVAAAGGQAARRSQTDRPGAPASGTAAPAQVPSSRPKWAALLEPGGRQYGAAHGTLCLPPSGKPAAPRAAQDAGGKHPRFPGQPARSLAGLWVMRRWRRKPLPLRRLPAPSAYWPSAGRTTGPSASGPSPASSASVSGSAGSTAVPAQSPRPAAVAPAQAPRGAVPQDPQARAAAEGAGANLAESRLVDNVPAVPDPSGDDILPSKPRASMRLRSRFQLPQIQCPR